MQKVNLKYVVLTSVIIALGFFLRIYHYWEFPMAEETADEIHWTWLGSSLLAEQKPTSWSLYSEYQPDYVVKEGLLPAPIVSPSLDHPPLFSFLPGSAHLLKNSDWLVIPSRKVIRLPLVFLSLITMGLFSWLSNKILPKKWALLAILIFATAPTFVFSSRLVVSENLLAVWALCSAIIIYYWNQSGTKFSKNKLARLIVLISILSLLSKIAGIIVPASFITYALITKDKKMLVASSLGLILGVASVLLYAAIYNFPLFSLIQFSQASRNIGLSTMYNRLFVHQNIAKYIFFDGWIILGLVSIFSWKFQESKRKSHDLLSFITLFVLINIGFIGTTVGEFTFHGWYNYSFFPFLPIFIVLFMKNMYESNSFGIILAWILLLPSIKNAYIFSESKHLLTDGVTRFWYFLGFTPIISKILESKKLKTGIYLLLLSIVITSGIITIITINQEVYRPFQDGFFFDIQLKSN